MRSKAVPKPPAEAAADAACRKNFSASRTALTARAVATLERNG